MNTKIIALLIASVVLIGMTGLVAAHNEQKTLQWDVATDTAFTVTFEGVETTIDFTCTSQTQNLVEPDSQNAAGTTPIIVLENTGNAILNMTCNLTTAIPAWATLKVSNESTHGDANEFDQIATLINASLKIGHSTDMYLWTNISSAPSGNTPKTIQINSEVAA